MAPLTSRTPLDEPAYITYFPRSLDGGTNGSPQLFQDNAINGKVCFVNVSVEISPHVKNSCGSKSKPSRWMTRSTPSPRIFSARPTCPAFAPASPPRHGRPQIREGHHDEVKRKLISDSYRKALDEKKIDVIGYPDIEEIQFGRGQNLAIRRHH